MSAGHPLPVEIHVLWKEEVFDLATKYLFGLVAEHFRHRRIHISSGMVCIHRPYAFGRILDKKTAAGVRV